MRLADNNDVSNNNYISQRDDGDEAMTDRPVISDYQRASENYSYDELAPALNRIILSDCWMR